MRPAAVTPRAARRNRAPARPEALEELAREGLDASTRRLVAQSLETLRRGRRALTQADAALAASRHLVGWMRAEPGGAVQAPGCARGLTASREGRRGRR